MLIRTRPVKGTTPVPIRTTCPHCQSAFNLANDLVDKKVRCTKCSQPFRVTAPVAETAQEEPSVRKAGSSSAGSGTSKSVREESQEKEARPRRRRRKRPSGDKPSRTFTALSLSLITLGAIVVLGGGGFVLYLLLQPDRPLQVSNADMEVLVTAERVGPKLHLTPKPNLGAASKVRDRSGWYRLSYEYGKVGEQKGNLFVRCVVTVADRESDAQVIYVRTNADLPVGSSDGKTGSKRSPRSDLFAWGDEWATYLLSKDGGADFTGNIVTTRKGNKVFHFIVTGGAITDKAGLHDLLDGPLAKLENYHP